MKVALIVPTLNAGELWDKWIDAILCQSLESVYVQVIDSCSLDETVNKSIIAGFNIKQIPVKEFNHGATRQLAADELMNYDILIFLTQDAILADSVALENVIKPFLKDEKIGIAYGRQLPRPGAGFIESHARYFNYSEISEVRTISDKRSMGIKAVFTSNSFAAYRKSALLDVGGFPSNTIVSEDMYVAANMLENNWKVAYCADAQVYHSHNYSMFQELQRYFDIGVFNARESWIRQQFGNAESEGYRFILSEFKFLLKRNFLLIPYAILRTIFKFIGYKLGVNEHLIPVSVKRALSMQKAYWK